jgi:phosphocarrier protein
LTWVVRSVSVRGRHGLHARPAAVLAKTAKKFRCRVTVVSESGSADGKSIVELMTLGIAGMSTVMIAADGDDAEPAIEELTALLAEGAVDPGTAEA